MIAQLGILVFLCVLSYVIIKVIPEIREWLKKTTINTYNTSHYFSGMPRSQSEQKKESEFLEEEDRETKLLENLDGKMNDLFMDPDMKPIKTNFDSLGSKKVSKKNIQKDEEELKKHYGNNEKK